MRKKLAQIGDQTRDRYKATIGRLGIKSNHFSGFPQRTVLLKDVTSLKNNEIVTDHLWFTCGKTLKELDLKSGDIIIFNARVGKYKKGSGFRKRDYTLKRPTKIEVIKEKRELLENEITSKTPPTLQELEEVRMQRRIEYYCCVQWDPAVCP